MRLPKLDARLQAALDMAPPCALGADIGADHGRLSAIALATGRCERMLVSDVSGKALDKARAQLARTRLDARCRFAVADGLTAADALPDGWGKPQTYWILGMGGRTIADVL